MELKHLSRDAVRELLIVMFEGWRLHEESYLLEPPHSGYSIDEETCYLQASGGDLLLARLAGLFSYWSNDVVSVAAHYGIGWLKDGTFSTDLPPPPSPDHWWDEGEWKPPFDDEVSEAKETADD